MLVPSAVVAVGAQTAPASPSGSDLADEEPRAEVFEENLREKMDARPGPMPVIVHFEDSVPSSAVEVLDGFDVQYRFQSIPAVYALAADPVVEQLAHQDHVEFIEDAHKPIEFLLDTSTVATRAKEVWDPTFTPEPGQVDTETFDSPNLTEETGYRVDGSGVGVAVVDTGLDTTHPDLDEPGKVTANYQVTPQGVVEAGPYTDDPSGHGTAAAGVVAGNGDASDGQFTGAAPDASLYGFSTVVANRATDETVDPQPEGTAVAPAVAFDWILQNHDDVHPSIQIVSNSWYCAAPACHTFNQDMAHNKLASKLAQDGVVLTWAAGNVEGSTGIAETTAEARNPTPGILGVSSFDDKDLGTRNSCTAKVSAEGNPDKPRTWPDLVAPGASVTTTAATVRADTANPIGTAAYAERRGTSIAAPHVAGIAALVLEANPGLNPAEVERVLENTAHELNPGFCFEGTQLPDGLETTYLKADPANPTDPADWKSGHGLVDAQEAVEAALSFSGIPEDEPEPVDVPPGIVGHKNPGFIAEERFYLAGDGKLVRERPAADQANRAVLQPEEDLVFTSDPLDEPVTTGGLDAAVFVGTLTENRALPLWLSTARPTVEVTLERVDPDGNVLDRVIDVENSWYRETGIPIERDFYEPVDREITFQEGDKIRLTIEALGALGRSVNGENPFPWTAAWGSEDRPAHVGFGPSKEHVEYGSEMDCNLLAPNCSWLDEDHPKPFSRCEPRVQYRLVWTGPPGSQAIMECNQATAVCQIPADADGWQTCEAQTLRLTGGARRGVPLECTYEVPEDFEPPEDPEIEGFHGYCTDLGDR